MSCIDDMRRNLTGSVRHGCHINVLHGKGEAQCCPTFDERNYLQYIGSTYPETLRCLKRVGCADTVFYSDILAECKNHCHAKLPDDPQVSVCLAGREGMFQRSSSAASLSKYNDSRMKIMMLSLTMLLSSILYQQE